MHPPLSLAPAAPTVTFAPILTPPALPASQIKVCSFVKSCAEGSSLAAASTFTAGFPADGSMVERMLRLLGPEPPKARTRLRVAFVAPAQNTKLKVFEGLQKHLLGKQVAGWSVDAFEEPALSTD